MLTPTLLIECDLLEGLEEVATSEINQTKLASKITQLRPGAMHFLWQGNLRQLLRLRSVVAASLVLTFAVPRPKALLGHQYFTAISAAAKEIIDMHPAGAFKTLRLSAAGEDSSVMQRLHHELANQLGLTPAEEEGDLLFRLRRSHSGEWEALLRISPRPLATRPWRVCNMPGAPNASLAYAVSYYTQPEPDDRLLNLCCGSGTLLIERLLSTPTERAVGCDLHTEALACAKTNLSAAGVAQRAKLEAWDVTRLPIDSQSIDVLIADLPFGQLIGTHQDNERLYPRLISEAARVAAPGARMALLSHELRLLERAIERYDIYWELLDIVRVRSGGMAPGIFVLGRR